MLWRVAWRDNVLILRSGPLYDDLAPPAGFLLGRVAATGGLDPTIAEKAMLEAGEEEGLVIKRLNNGDQFFGWLSDDRVVSFGWVSRWDRAIGPTKLRDAEGRVFLYNFYTVTEQRGRGLYPLLLLHMRRVLTDEGLTEFIIDVDIRNTASARGIAKAGFEPMARTTYLTVFRHWHWEITKAYLDQFARHLFE